MRKFLLFLLPALVLACEPVIPKPTYAESPLDNKVVALSHNSTMEWKCTQDEINDSVIWFNCKFHNMSQLNDQQACLKMTYYTGVTQEVVATSRVACTGPVDAGLTTNTYVAFQKQPRKEVLVICGADSSYCRLTVTSEPTPPLPKD